MTIVNENMSAAKSLRFGRTGGKDGSGQLESSGGHSGFKDAFADIGRGKKQTTTAADAVRVDGQAHQRLSVAVSVDGATASDIPVAADRIELSQEMDSTMRLSLPAAKGDMVALPAVTVSTKIDMHTEAEQASAADVRAGNDGKVPFEKAIATKDLAVHASKVKLDAPEAEPDPGIADKSMAKKAKDPDGDKLTVVTDGLADESAESSPVASGGDVSHLLTLLGQQSSVDVTPQAQVQSAPLSSAHSDFQELADLAGGLRHVARNTTDAKSSEALSERDSAAPETIENAGSDQTFRFARADGKGQAVAMRLSADGDSVSVKNDQSPTQGASAKVETVTVVEARRYLGLAPSGNATAITNQIAGNTQWSGVLSGSTSLTPAAADATGKVLNTLKIQMHPIDLGTVTATLRLKDDALQVDLRVETGEAFRQLSDDQSEMIKALRAQGFAVDQVNIVFNAASDSSGGNAGSQPPPQPQTGQQGREAAADGGGQGRGQSNDGSGSQGQDRGRWTGNEGSGHASSGIEPSRSGDVYM